MRIALNLYIALGNMWFWPSLTKGCLLKRYLGITELGGNQRTRPSRNQEANSEEKQ